MTATLADYINRSAASFVRCLFAGTALVSNGVLPYKQFYNK